jgi:hypothetical protein
MTFGQLRIIFGTMSFAFFGSFYLPGGWSVPMPFWGEPPSSILASKCERLWLDEARNDPSMECYMTSQPDRLCRQSEKDHLVWMASRYQKARSLYEGKLWGYVIGVQRGMLTTAGGKNEGVQEKLTRVSAMEAARLKKDEAFVKAMKMPSLLDSELTTMMRRLAEKGYVSADDFGWSAPAWVSEAFDGPLKVKSVCPKPEA